MTLRQTAVYAIIWVWEVLIDIFRAVTIWLILVPYILICEVIANSWKRLKLLMSREEPYL